MTLTSTLNFDAIAEAAAVTVSAPWDVSGVAPTGAAAAAVHGARGARWSSTDAYGRILYDFGSNQAGPLVLSWYMQIRTFSSANLYIAYVTDLLTGGTTQGDVRINATTNTISIRNGVTAVATSTATVSLDTIYRFEWRIDATANTQELRVYTGESTTPFITLTGAWSSDTTRLLAVGPYIVAAGGSVDYDTVRIADDWVGPFGTSAPVTAWRVYTSTGWEPVFAHSL